MTRFRSIAGFVWLTVGVPGTAHACSCIDPKPACQAYWKTDAVFDATVVSMQVVTRDETLGDRVFRIPEKLVKLTVSKSWKGVEPGDVEVVTAFQSSACGFDFRVSERYLVFAHRRPNDGRLEVSSCSNTRPFDQQRDAQSFLTSLSQPATGGTIFGTVRTAEDRFNPSLASRAPIEAQIRLSGNGKDIDVASSAGRYEVRGLAPGNYLVDITLPHGYEAYGTFRTAEIPNGRSCAQIDFSVSPTGRIFGRVVDPDGHPLPQVIVEVTTPNAPSKRTGPEPLIATTGMDGEFLVDHLSPGRYIVGVNLRDLLDDRHPYARSVYPGGDASPHVIELALGETVQLGDWRLPPPRANPAIRLKIQRDSPVRYP